MSVRTQAEDHIEQSSPIYIDYGDYTDYANDIDYGDGVINRNQCNQYMPAITQVSDDVGQSSSTWIDYDDYSGGPRDAQRDNSKQAMK